MVALTAESDSFSSGSVPRQAVTLELHGRSPRFRNFSTKRKVLLKLVEADVRRQAIANFRLTHPTHDERNYTRWRSRIAPRTAD
ncbi:MAG: hypothetical protein SW833_21520 [Cyanobacteriota bacterium]|nr:hypothetical protein [Cyanobacteriota bacterium]